MGKVKKPIIAFILWMIIFVSCAVVCLLNINLLKRPILQKTTDLMVASSAKYEKDGNLYIIDNGSFRLVSMTPEGNINYSITIDKMKEYTRIYDSAVDDAGNLYVYAMEMEYDAYLSKRDMIRKYDNKGNFVKTILDIPYDGTSEDRPRGFAQFGSLRCENGVLTFSRTQEKQVQLYSYDTYRDKMSTGVFSQGGSGYLTAKLTLKDFDNFIYSTRDGNIFEVQNGGPPQLRGSFSFTLNGGGIIPWELDYDSNGDILFFDMASGTIFRIDSPGRAEKVLPQTFFDELAGRGLYPQLTGYGFFGNRFAGVFGYLVWYYDGGVFKTYEDGVNLSLRERGEIIGVQACFVVGVIALLAWIYLLFVRILERYVSLFIKQTIIVIPLTIAALIVLYGVTHSFMTKRINQEIFNELNLAASLSAGLINGDDVDSLKNVKDYNSAEYKRLSQALKNIVGNNKDEWNKGYYAALYVGKNFEYWVAISSDEVNMFRPASYLKEGTENYKIFMSGKPFVGIVDAIDGQWGYSDVPVRNSRGEIAGMFELALDMTSYKTRNAVERRQISLVAALISLIISLALIGVLSIIVRQLATVANVLADIAGGNYSQRIRYKARDELGIVSRGLNTMAEELQSRFAQIKSLNESTIRFVPVQFMEHLGVTDITKMKLGDHVQRDLTVLFFDIRAFSVNSEIMSARENFLFINRVLGVAGPILRKHNGFVDKYLGDAAMALFVNARDAVRAGIEVYQKLIIDKKTRIRIGGDGLKIGVGLHTGSVMMGIVGENERLSSTVISKNVNMASRLESLTKQTGSAMLISRDTMNQLSGSEKEFNYRFIGMIRAAGVNEVVGVFDILDPLPADIKKKRMETKKIFESGIRKYHTRDYAAALKRFEKVVAMDPGDICAANCLSETRRRLKDPSLPSVFMFDKK
jgi:class 3 adenylate cyclase